MISEFTAVRPRLMGLAYRMLGSWSEAEDVVQEAWLRWSAAETGAVERPAAWLARVVSHLCLDVLKSARSRREVYVGPWLPEPVLTQEGMLSGEPVDGRGLSMAFLRLLESLSPLERVVYVLSEAFDYRAEEVAEVIEREPAAVRQLLHRARAHVQEGRVRFALNREAHAKIVEAFAMACSSGEVEALGRLMAADVVVRTDGGGKARAALREVYGADKSARLMLGTLKKASSGLEIAFVDVNGWPGVVAYVDGVPISVMELETDGEKIFSIHIVVNPDKLRHIPAVSQK